MRSRTMSFVEALANVLVGYGVGVATQVMVFPLFGLNASLDQNLVIGLIFTIVSLVRSYALRRVFNLVLQVHAQDWPNVLSVRQQALVRSQGPQRGSGKGSS
jgi:hypothetical protein